MTQEDVKRPGRYTAQLTVWQPGEYRLTLPVPQSSERLTQTFRAVVPKLEEENPQRNVALLKEIAKKTGGGYFGELSAAFAGEASLASRLKDVGRRDKVPLATQAEEDEKLLRWMLIALCTILGVEWLVRRLVKLA
jgi:hypothetical protein